MSKHIAGLCLFSFIVSVSCLISFVFQDFSEPQGVFVSETTEYKNKKTVCYRLNSDTFEPQFSARVVQAVLNERTKKLDTGLFIEREDDSTESVWVALHFFAKNGKGTRYLASESVWLQPEFDAENEAVHGIFSSYKWLDELGSYDNLYIIAQPLSNRARHHNYNGIDKNFVPDFDESKAIGIISLKGE